MIPTYLVAILKLDYRGQKKKTFFVFFFFSLFKEKITFEIIGLINNHCLRRTKYPACLLVVTLKQVNLYHFLDYQSSLYGIM